MNTRQRPLAAQIRVALTLGVMLLPMLVCAHEDQRLTQALAADPGHTGKLYQRITVLTQIANLYQELGDAPQYARLLAEAKQLKTQIVDPYVRQYLAGHTANEIATTGDFATALQVLSQIEDREVWIKTAWKLVRKLSKAGHTEQARTLLKACEEKAHGVSDLALRAELLSGTGGSYRHVDPQQGVALVYEAHGIAQTLADPYERAIQFNECGAHLMDIGHRTRAVVVFDSVEKLVPRIPSPLQQAQVLAMLGGEQAEKGLRDRAATALQQAWNIAVKLAPSEEAFAVQSEIARNFGQSYRFDLGIQAATTIPDLYHRAEGYIRIAMNMPRQQQQAQALQLLEQTALLAERMTDPFRQAIILRKLASEHHSLQQPQQAKALLGQALLSSQNLAADATR